MCVIGIVEFPTSGISGYLRPGSGKCGCFSSGGGGALITLIYSLPTFNVDDVDYVVLMRFIMFINVIHCK